MGGIVVGWGGMAREKEKKKEKEKKEEEEGDFRFFPVFGKIFGVFSFYVNGIEWGGGEIVDINGLESAVEVKKGGWLRPFLFWWWEMVCDGYEWLGLCGVWGTWEYDKGGMVVLARG